MNDSSDTARRGKSEMIDLMRQARDNGANIEVVDCPDPKIQGREGDVVVIDDYMDDGRNIGTIGHVHPSYPLGAVVDLMRQAQSRFYRAHHAPIPVYTIDAREVERRITATMGKAMEDALVVGHAHTAGGSSVHKTMTDAATHGLGTYVFDGKGQHGPWRPISPKRARKLRRRGEHVVWSFVFGSNVWIPPHLREEH